MELYNGLFIVTLMAIIYFGRQVRTASQHRQSSEILNLCKPTDIIMNEYGTKPR